jgi:hypothetical protein
LPVIPATLEVEIWRMEFEASSGKKWDPISTNKPDLAVRACNSNYVGDR